MALSDAIVTNGTTLQVGDGASPTEAFAAIAEVVDIDPPGAEAEEVEVTHLLSEAKEFKGGLADFGEGTFTINLIPGDTSQEQLEDDTLASPVPTRNYRIMFPDGTNGRAFAGFVKMFKIQQIAVDAALRAQVTLRATGPVTRVP
jgi:hypothetical protein